MQTQRPRREVRGRGFDRSGDPGAEEDKMKAGGWAVTLGLLMLSAGPVIAASDERGAVSASGGVFVPYNGSAGPSATLSAEGRVTDALSVGGELEYRQFDVDGVAGTTASVESLHARALVRYTWDSGIVRPYVGAGAGVGIHDVSGTIRDHGDLFGINGTAVSLGVLGLAGVDLPLGDRFALFAEGRVSGDFATNLLSGTQLGGASAMSGACW